MIPATIVDVDYEHDPNDETTLEDSKRLKDGMVVLIEDKNLRINLHNPMSTRLWMRALEKNRWFEVRNVSSDNGIVYFEAKYADGKTKTRWCKIDTPWIVRRDSM